MCRDLFRFPPQVWMNLSIKGIHPGSNMLMVVLVDEMAKAAEMKPDAELKAGI